MGQLLKTYWAVTYEDKQQICEYQIECLQYAGQIYTSNGTKDFQLKKYFYNSPKEVYSLFINKIENDVIDFTMKKIWGQTNG